MTEYLYAKDAREKWIEKSLCEVIEKPSSTCHEILKVIKSWDRSMYQLYSSLSEQINPADILN